MEILVFNAGSSSLKASLLEVGRREPLASASVSWGSDATRAGGRRAAIAGVLDELGVAGGRAAPAAVGHRLVHGGAAFRQATLVDDAVLEALTGVSGLAPLHNKVALETIRLAGELLPGLPHVAAFDTAFHADLPPEGYVYALPWHWYEAWGIRRYGFHGLSVAWATRRAGELLGRPPAELSLVVAHLGSGCSVTAVEAGKSAATSMGFTPLEGLMMGTRAGSFDPGIVLHLLREGRVTVDELAEAVDHESGLLGISGISGDVRQVSEAAHAGHGRARLALDIFVRRTAEAIAATATALPKLDALVFSGGIGEHAGELRARIAERLWVIGLERISSDEPGFDGVRSAQQARVSVLRVEAREDVVIAEDTAALLRQS